MRDKGHIVFAVINDLTYDRRMHRICSSLQQHGYAVTLVGRRLRNSTSLPSQLFTQHRLRCWFTRGLLFYAEYNIRLFFHLMRCRADVIGAVDLDTAPAVRLAGWMRRRKTVFDAHEHFAEVPEVHHRPLVRGVWHWIGKVCISRFHLRYTVSQTLAQALEQDYKAPFHVIRNVPSLTGSQITAADTREKLIVYQGALNEGRGLEAAILAMHRLPEFKLCLIGEGDLSDQLRSIVSEQGLQSRVEFAGYVLPGDLEAHTVNAMIGLNLLESRSKSYYLSLANKFFDYMHAGVPSMNMCFPEYEMILNSHPVGVCIDALGPEAIADCVRKMISDDQNGIETMINACTKARQLFCWQNEERVLLDLYTALTG